MLTRKISDEAAMLAFGGELAERCPIGTVIFLYGDLGAGKTTLVRGFLRALGYTLPVKSPTYTLVESYFVAHRPIFHFDLYRLVDPEELEHIGIRDYFSGDAICLVEWPERGGDRLPTADISCYIEINGAAREVRVVASSQKGEVVLS